MEIFYYLIGFIMGAAFVFLLKNDGLESEYVYDTPEEERENLRRCGAIVATVVIVLLIISAGGMLL